MFESFGTYILYFLLSYIGLTLFFYTLSAFSVLPQASSFYARTLTSYGCLIICATYGVFASLFLRLVQNHRISQWTVARSYHYLMWWTTGVRFTIVSGEEHLKTRPMVLIGNHQSSLDVLFLADIWPKYCSVTAKDSLKRAPFLGWFMALSGTVFINRTDRVSAIKAFEGAAQEIRRERQSVFIFPEGTRHPGREPVLGDFKKGAFHLAVQAGVPIVPVVSANYWGVLSVQERRFRGGKIPAKGVFPYLYNLWLSFVTFFEV